MTDKVNKISKTKGSALALTGNLRDNCSIIDPVVDIANATFDYNYAYITQFSRFYFIKNIIMLRTGLFRVEMHVDVLESNETAIKNLTAVIKRQQGVYNLYLDDPLFKAQNKRQVQTKKLNGGFSPNLNSGNPCFVLTVAGGD